MTHNETPNKHLPSDKTMKTKRKSPTFTAPNFAMIPGPTVTYSYRGAPRCFRFPYSRCTTYFRLVYQFFYRYMTVTEYVFIVHLL